MIDFFNNFYKNQSQLYKVILLALTTIFIVFLFPKSGRFKYDFEKGKPWQSENLYAPFNFAIDKSDVEINEEKVAIEESSTHYFSIETNVFSKVASNFDKQFDIEISDTLDNDKKLKLKSNLKQLLNSIYKVGFLDNDINLKPNAKILVLENNVEKIMMYIHNHVHLILLFFVQLLLVPSQHLL